MGPIQSAVNQTIQNVGIIRKLKGIEKSTAEVNKNITEINERTKKKYDNLIKETEASPEWKDISTALDKFKNDPSYRDFDVEKQNFDIKKAQMANTMAQSQREIYNQMTNLFKKFDTEDYNGK